MTQSGRMFPAGIRGLARALASGLLVLAASGLAAAEGEPPRLPQISDTPMVVDIPAAPENVDAVLVERMAVDGVSPARFSSQDFVVNQDDSQGADDFCIPAGDASWVITNVDVVGAYNVASGYSTSSVNVYFMAHNAGHVPGTQLYFANVAPAGGSVSTGSFQMTLGAPAHLAGNTCYWLSVQAVQPGGFNAGETWQWTERTAASADHSASAYRLPGKPGNACQAWGARLATCFPSSLSNPDFTLRLSGNISNTHFTPQITGMSPIGGLNEDITLSLTGANFAQGAVISWTVGVSPTEVFTPTVIDGGHISVNIPAAAVGPQGSTASVRVSNPAPCLGSCDSNAKTFFLVDATSVYLPVSRR